MPWWDFSRHVQTENLLLLSDEEEIGDQEGKVFDDKTTAGHLGNLVVAFLSRLGHVTVVLSSVCFLLAAFSCGVNSALEITLEMVAPLGDSINSKNFFSMVMFFFLCCTFIWLSFVLSLFWHVVKLTWTKRSSRWQKVKAVIFMLLLLISGVYAATTSSQGQIGVVYFLEVCLYFFWWGAFVNSILGSLFLLRCVYEDETEGCWTGLLVTALFIIFITAILAPVAFHLVDASSGAMAFAFFYPFFTAVLLLYLWQRGCKKTLDRNYRLTRVSFVVNKSVAIMIFAVYCGIVILILSSRPSCSADCEIELSSNTSSLGMRRSREHRNASSPGYPVCHKQWGKSRLNVADFAFITGLTYKVDSHNPNAVQSTVNKYFQGRGFNWSVISITTTSPAFYHIADKNTKVHVVGIRGTQDERDWYENMKIWNEIATFQITSSILPIQRLPLDFIASYVSRAAYLDDLFHNGDGNYYFRQIEDYVETILQQTRNSTSDTWELYLVGHSMGGGLAKIIGSRKKLPSVAFCSPGEVYSSKKFGYTLDDVQRFAVSVVAENDAVTWVDRHGGLVQYIKCDASGFKQCHSIANTYCQLKTSCGFQSPVDC